MMFMICKKFVGDCKENRLSIAHLPNLGKIQYTTHTHPNFLRIHLIINKGGIAPA